MASSSITTELTDNFHRNKKGYFKKFIINLEDLNILPEPYNPSDNLFKSHDLETQKNIYNFHGLRYSTDEDFYPNEKYFDLETKKNLLTFHGLYSPSYTLCKNEQEMVKQKITKSLQNVNIPIVSVGPPCTQFRNKVVHDKKIVDDLQVEIYKKYPKLRPHESILLPIYFKMPSFGNIIWLRVPAVIMSYDTKLQIEIEKLTADWVCRNYNLTNKEANETVTETIVTNKLKEKRVWIYQFNKKYMNVTSKLYTSPLREHNHFYVLEYSYIYTNKYICTNKDVQQKGLVGIILMYCKHNKVGKIILQDFATIHLSANIKSTSYEDFENLLNRNKEANIYYYSTQNTYLEALFYNNVYPWSGLLLTRFHHLWNLLPLIRIVKGSIAKSKEICLDKKIHSNACALCNGINLLLNLGCNIYIADWRIGNGILKKYTFPEKHSNMLKYNHKGYYRVCGEVTFMHRPYQPYLNDIIMDEDEPCISLCKCYQP